jgi:rhodanese-related sulfurtransferase
MENLFEGVGITINNFKHLTPTEAYECCKKGAVIIDVREEYMSHVKTFDVPEIEIFPLRLLSENIKKLPKDKFLIFADATGIKSKPAMEFAAEERYKNIANLAGGLVEWERDGMPTNTYQRIRVRGSNKYEFVYNSKSKK